MPAAALAGAAHHLLPSHSAARPGVLAAAVCRSELSRYERALHDDYFTVQETGKQDQVNHRVGTGGRCLRWGSEF